jgi:hypothetical protein
MAPQSPKTRFSVRRRKGVCFEGPRYQKVGTLALPLGTVHVPIPPAAFLLGTSDFDKILILMCDTVLEGR